MNDLLWYFIIGGGVAIVFFIIRLIVFSTGYREGRLDGYEQGVHDGYDAGQQQE